jgi:L-amino acid N-acyltransferase YncA
MQIRDALLQDQAGILEIYNDAVVNTTSVWNETPRSFAEQVQWFEAKKASGFPVLVAVEGDEVAGFCSYGPFRPWYGYRFTVEGSIYVASHHRRKGIARQSLATLLTRAQAQGLHAIVAGIEAENLASIRLHEEAGYQIAGRLPQVGMKFGRWLDLIFMQRLLHGAR